MIWPFSIFYYLHSSIYIIYIYQQFDFRFFSIFYNHLYMYILYYILYYTILYTIILYIKFFIFLYPHLHHHLLYYFDYFSFINSFIFISILIQSSNNHLILNILYSTSILYRIYNTIIYSIIHLDHIS